MKILKINAIIFLAIIFGCSGINRAEHQALKAGAAMRIVNPHKPTAPVGDDSTTRYPNVYADLRVQALVIEDEAGKRIVWMGWDFIDAHHLVVDRVKKMVYEKYHIDPEVFCINSSHTHSAPPLLQREAVSPDYFDSNYADFVVSQAVEVVGDAIKKLVPAKLKYSEQMCTSVGINRRGHPTYTFTPNLKGPVDHRVQIVSAKTIKDDKLIAVVVKYACHPEAVGPKGLGSDYPGFMRQFIEKRHPGAVAIFLQGCGGNIACQIINDNATRFMGWSMEKAKMFGQDLSMAVEQALNKRGKPVLGPIEVEYETLELPLNKVPDRLYKQAAVREAYPGAWGKKFSEMLERDQPIPTTWPYRVQVFRLGSNNKTPFILVALQGEVFVEYGLWIDERLKPANTIVLGYSNDATTYLPTSEAFKQGGYEIGAFYWWLVPGPYTPEVESIVLEAVTKLALQKSP